MIRAKLARQFGREGDDLDKRFRMVRTARICRLCQGRMPNREGDNLIQRGLLGVTG